MKQAADEFAILGGRPQFDNALLVGRPALPDQERLLSRIRQVLNSGVLTNGGPMVQEFERRLAAKLSVRHVVAVCNGTMALQMMAKACDLKGEVIVPSMTFIATAHALAWVGLTPVFADVDRNTHTLDPSSVDRCINERTSAILGVHLWGNFCHGRQLQIIADRYGLPVLFDSSHTFGCSRTHLANGESGLAEAISFHATKVMHSVEGGAVITNDDTIAQKCRLMRNFGISGLTQIDALGINGKMNELCAAAGITCLEDIDSVLLHNNLNLETYRIVIDGVAGLEIALPETQDQTNAQYAVVTVDEAAFGMGRDQLIEVLRAEGVFARAYFAPGCHNAPPYAGSDAHSPVPLPITDKLLTTIMQLPTGPGVSPADIRRIGRLLVAIQRHSCELKQKLRTHSIHQAEAA